MSWKHALVTGASSGIGRGLAERIAATGALVVLCARRERELGRVAEGIERAGGHAKVAALDVGDTERTVAAIRALDEEVGGLDLVVANAGVGAPPPASPLAWETLRHPCHVNFCGAVATLTAVLPQMVARGRGHIVGVSSLASFGALPASGAYCAPKAGLSMLLECLRLDLLDTGVAATTIHAGFVRTAMVEHATFPMPMLMSVEEAVDLVMLELPKRPATIDFPRPLALAARVAAGLPRSLRELAARRQRAVR